MRPQVRLLGAEEAEAANLPGIGVRVLLGAAETDGTLALLEQTLKPGDSVSVRYHQEEDLAVCVVEGSVELRTGSDTVHMRAGSAVYIPRNAPHALRATGGGSARLIITVTPPGLELFCRECARHNLSLERDSKQIETLGAEYGIRCLREDTR